MHLRLCIMLFLPIMTLQSIDQQLLMFVHTQSRVLTDEEGLNVAYQALTAIRQHAAPILMSENIWQHVVLRSDRFKKGLKYSNSLQKKVVTLHADVHYQLKNYRGQIDVVNKLCNDAWFEQRYSHLKSLDAMTYKHLLFDYFCYDIGNHFGNWEMYQLQGGYLLWIPNNQSVGFTIQQIDRQDIQTMKKAVWTAAATDLDKVLCRYVSSDKNIHWTFYATGHGYHKDTEREKCGVIGITLQSFHDLLVFFDKECRTKLFVYSSCYGAGQHSVIPYVDDNKNDLLLSYPVILISLTDAPSYVFGVPSGFKLPPYNAGNMLTPLDEHKETLAPFFLQDFNRFCLLARENSIDINLVKAINPYEQCFLNTCSIVKIENLPLVRFPHTSYFIPLDQSQVFLLIGDSPNTIEMNNKAALLLYTYSYDGVIQLKESVPFFVSMIPGDQVHCIRTLNAEGINFSYLIRKMFLSIDDIQEQNIYMFEKIVCSLSIPEVSKKRITTLQDVLILPAGPWLPYFERDTTMSCHVYAQIQNHLYAISFDQHKQISSVEKLQKKDVAIIQQFKNFLIQEYRSVKEHTSMRSLLSSKHSKHIKSVQQDALEQCLKKKICNNLF